ncbi:hypothetical protein [Proteiniborus sp. MB09-C3]|uniref:hypothetical protein n=1 Tax=Proteiniborus sp. MB09-C3 TaxID=3050072 RepID=UPI0025534BF6|nr:hypothetical protein [Proteiniborus sp. MB09-C3]WIV10466.1 hypothetical protein QO263_09855 [Proteiniborus sp. MB09-C3]
MEEKLRKYINRKFLLYPKTKEIIEVRDELYSIMIDKYNDCFKLGVTQEEAYKRATEMMIDYKDAIREVEKGSSLGAFKKILINIDSFTTFYFITLTCIYFFVSVIILKSFKKTWLITVGGSFIYLTYFSISLYKYAKLFNFKTLGRWGLAFIYISLIPLVYVFPSLYLSIVHSKNIWSHSWLVVIIIVFFYIITDYIVNRKHISIVERDILIFVSGFLLTTFLYLFISMKFSIWSIAWILYVFYLSLISMIFYIGRNKRRDQKERC